MKAARQVIGATDPLEAAPGSIRGDFAVEMGQNMVHGSDSPESAAREAALFFPELLVSAPVGASAGPRLPLAAAAGDPRAPGGGVHGASHRRARSSSSGDPGEVALENALRKAARRAAAPRPARRGGGWCSAATRWWRWTARSTASPRDEREARATLRALSGATHEVVSGLALLLRRRSERQRTAVARTAVTLPRARRGAARLVPGPGRVARAGRRLRDPGRRRGAGARRSTATTRTSSACRWRPARHLPRAPAWRLHAKLATADRRSRAAAFASTAPAASATLAADARRPRAERGASRGASARPNPSVPSLKIWASSAI